jgi:hypothetical protein
MASISGLQEGLQVVHQSTFLMKDVGNIHLLVTLLKKRDYIVFLSTYFDDILP